MNQCAGGGGVIPEFNFTALPTQLVALSLTLSVYLSVFAALRTTKHYSPSHMCPPPQRGRSADKRGLTSLYGDTNAALCLGFVGCGRLNLVFFCPHPFFFFFPHGKYMQGLLSLTSETGCRQTGFDENGKIFLSISSKLLPPPCNLSSREVYFPE